MAESKTKDVWVFVETTPEGKAKKVGLELLSPGRDLAQKLEGELVAVVIGSSVEAAVQSAAEGGADEVIVVEAEAFSPYTTDAYTHALCTICGMFQPAALLIGATNNGRDLGPRVSGRLETGLVADCTSLDIDEKSGDVAWTRPAFGGNLMATIMCPDHRPQMGTVRPGVFKPPAPAAAHAKVTRVDVALPADCIRTRLVEILDDLEGGEVDLENAQVIVSGGRGVGGPEGFKLLQRLADELGGVVGASRAAVDSGWIAHAHQVGQTGKSVSPHLYIACGISGAVQHLAGMSGSDIVIAINRDSSAPIFGAADFGVVGDLFEVVPALIEVFGKSEAA